MKAKFWHGELLFIAHNEKMSKWKRIAKKVKSSWSEEEYKRFANYNINELALILFIKSVYEEWYPFEDTSWIKEY